MTPGGIEQLLDDRYPEKRSRIGSDDGFPVKSDYGLPKAKKRKPMYSLRVVQQPERARLCSFKEENETIDRRPVDPPPVVELLLDDTPCSETDSGLTKFFIRASIVHPQPLDADSPHTYTPVKTPTGADASAGEVVQTPERLRTLEGEVGQLVIFAKLSVRMPGVFRLKFTLFQTSDSGILEITNTISEPFEVFSPKLFKGMRESTALTRHLAAQGLKVKLRTDTSVGRQSEARRGGSGHSQNMSPQPPYRTASDTPLLTYVSQYPASVSIPSPNVSTPPHSAPPGSLVWRDQDPYRRPTQPGSVSQYPSGPGPSYLSGPPYTPSNPNYNHHPNPYPHSHLYASSPSHSQPHSQAQPQRRSPTRPYHMDEGTPPSMWNPAPVPSLTWTPRHSSDLAAFSLNRGQGPNHLSHPQAGSSSMSSRHSSRQFSPYSTQPSSLQSRTSSERSETVPTFGNLRIKGQDDGFSLLPIFPTQPSVSNLISDTPTPPVMQDPGGVGQLTLPPIRLPDPRDGVR